MRASKMRLCTVLHRMCVAKIYPGFTLLELLVVLIIVAMLSSIVAVQLTGYFSNASLSKAVDRLKMLDSAARRDASVQPAGTIELEFDRSEQILRIANQQSGFQLPTGVLLKAIWLPGPDGRFQTVGADNARVKLSAMGTSQDYAIEFIGRGGATLGVLVLGLSGQFLRFENADDLQELL